MSLDQAAAAFFQAIQKAGADTLGHARFGFKIDISLAVAPEDAEIARLINAQIQAALNTARTTTTAGITTATIGQGGRLS